MRTQSLLICLNVCLMIGSSCFAQEATISQLNALLPEIGAKSIEDRAAAQQQWEQLCYPLGEPQNPQRKAVCIAITEMLDRPRVRYSAKSFMVKQLERIGRDEVVPILTQLLSDEKDGLREAARRALANNPAPSAGKALIARYRKAKNATEKRAILNAIGYRAESTSAQFLTSVARNSTGPVLVAANAALSRVARNPGVLRKGQDKDAILRRADQLAASGKTAEAITIYRSLLENLSDNAFGNAAFIGLLNHVDEAEAIELINQAMSGDDRLRQQTAMARIRSLSPTGLLQISQSLNERTDVAKVAILTAIGSQHSDSALAAVTEATKSDSPTVRRAALEALAGIGNADSADLLFETLLQTPDDQERELAKSSLVAIRDPAIDTKLVARFKRTSITETQLLILEILNNRRAVAALPTFVTALSSDSELIRQRAVGAISRLGSEKEVSSILAVLGSFTGREKDRVEKQIVNYCRRLPTGSEPVLSYFRSSTPETQTQLLPLLGRIGDDESLPTIRRLMSGPHAGLREASELALANWPTATVAGDLRKLATSAKSAGSRIRAQRALARVAVLGGTDAEKLEHLQFVMKNATRDDERNLAIERAKAVRTVDSLNFVLPHIEDKVLGKRARRTVIDLAHHRALREENRGEFGPALERIIPLMQDAKQLERAEKYLANE